MTESSGSPNNPGWLDVPKFQTTKYIRCVVWIAKRLFDTVVVIQADSISELRATQQPLAH